MNVQETPRVVRLTYTVPEVAVMLGLSKNACYVAARQGKLPFRILKIGARRFVFARAEVDKVLAGEGA